MSGPARQYRLVFLRLSAIVSLMARWGVAYLCAAVRARVESEGLRPLSARTGIPVGQLRSLMQGRAALSTTLESAASALGLEFYIGPPLERDSDGMARASDDAAGRVQLDPAVPVEEPVPTWATRLQVDLRASFREELVAILRGFTDARRSATPVHGQPIIPPAVPGKIHDRLDAGYVTIRRLGPEERGSTKLEHAPVVGYLAFQRSWLERHSIDPDRCTIVEVQGAAMEPTLPDGCSILVDHRRRQRRLGHIYVLRTGGDLIVRRAGKDQSGHWVLLCDHPQQPRVPWSDRESDVAGEVRWMARTLF